MASLRLLPLSLLAAVLLAAPTAALAQRTNAPPGNSGIDQYLETVPGAKGNSVPRGPGGKGGSGKRGASALTPAQRQRLDRLGPDGRAVAAAVDATAPESARKNTEAQPLPDAAGRSPLDQMFEAFRGGDDGDGMGALLPAILVAALLGTLALVLVRRRSAS